MKRFLSSSFCLVIATALAGSAITRSSARADDFSALPSPRAHEAWSAAGSWLVHHPDWTGTLTLEKNGEFARTEDHDSGRWTLAAVQDRVVLVLAWDHWPAETVTMISPDFFCSKVRGQGQEAEMTLHRVPGRDGRFLRFETARWRQGEPPVRLMRVEEGFCALTGVTGSFQGSGESVRVYVGDDGYWYLGGDSHQEGVAAECILVRYALPAGPSAGTASGDQ